jgi:hypothetical protein
MTAAVETNPETPYNPPAEQCECWMSNAPQLHALLLGFEDASATEAARILGIMITDDDLNIGDEHAHFDPSDFRWFVAQHNWKDPAQLALAASYVETASFQAHFARHHGWKPEGTY